MKTYLDLKGTRYAIDDVDSFTHVVIAQRNITREDPTPGLMVPDGKGGTRMKRSSEMTHEEHAARVAFVTAEIGGRYRLKPVKWAQSEEEANAIAAKFTEPEWLDVQVLPVSGCLEHA